MDYGSGHMLTSLLQSMQLSPTRLNVESSKVLSTCVGTLPRLTNPLNVSLLSTQILSAPAFWHVDDLLKASVQIFGVYRSASLAKAEQERPTVSISDWIEAIVRGGDERVPYWKHILAPAAVLSAFPPDDARVPNNLRVTLERQFCEVLNSCLSSSDDVHCFTGISIFCYIQDALSEEYRELISYDALLFSIVRMLYLSKQGFQLGDFLERIDAEVVRRDNRLEWKSTSPSYNHLLSSIRGPILGNISSLAKLTALAVRRSQNPGTVNEAVEMMLFFSQNLLDFWRANKLSSVEPGRENELLSRETAETTTPLLWQILKLMLFTSVTVFQSVVSRLLQDRAMIEMKARVASRVIETLQGMYFISSRMGTQGFATYNFVFYGAIDIVTSNPMEVEQLITKIGGGSSSEVAENPVQKVQDLFYLNAAEHLVIACSPRFNEDITLPKVMGYLSTGTRNGFREPFEAAHAVILAIVSTPSTAELCAKILPLYVETVFQQFPNALSPRQFRLVVSTLIKESSPPTPLSALNHTLPSVILEILHARIEHGSTAPLPTITSDTNDAVATGIPAPTQSERDICMLALLDAIPFMEPQLMEVWLDQAGMFLAQTPDSSPSKDMLRGRLWDMMSSELDIERAQIAVQWWSQIGRNQVLGDGREHNFPRA